MASAKSLSKSLDESLTKSLAETLSRLSLRLLARLLARHFALAKRLPRVSDQIIYMALRKTLSETRFFYAGSYQFSQAYTVPPLSLVQ